MGRDLVATGVVQLCSSKNADFLTLARVIATLNSFHTYPPLQLATWTSKSVHLLSLRYNGRPHLTGRETQVRMETTGIESFTNVIIPPFSTATRGTTYLSYHREFAIVTHPGQKSNLRAPVVHLIW